MRNGVDGPNGEGAIQHTCQKRNAISPPRDIDEIYENKIATRMLVWYSRQHDDGHKTTPNDQRHASVLQYRYQSVCEYACQRNEGGHKYVRDVDVPRLDNEVRVKYGVELNSDIGDDLRDGGEVKEPTEKVDAAGEETEDTAPLQARGDGGVVVNLSRSRGFSKCFENHHGIIESLTPPDEGMADANSAIHAPTTA